MTLGAGSVVTTGPLPQVRAVLRNRAVAGLMVAAAACSTESSNTGPPPPPPASQGMVAGVVRDSAGRAVPNATVCATTVFSVSGTPAIVSNIAHTKQNGSYLVPLNFSADVDTIGGLTVAATPSAASGLSPAYVSGRTLRMSSTPPPAETTRVDIVVPKGPTFSGVFCTFGP